MARTRALLTETERKRIETEGAGTDSKRYQAVSRVRGRIHDELPKDVRVLKQHHPELFEELREVVCDITE